MPIRYSKAIHREKLMLEQCRESLMKRYRNMPERELSGLLNTSPYSVSMVSKPDGSFPGGHGLITINHELADGRVEVLAALGLNGSLAAKDFFGLYTNKSKVLEESHKLTQYKNASQNVYRITPEQLELLFKKINLDRRENAEKIPRYYVAAEDEKLLTKDERKENTRNIHKFKMYDAEKTQQENPSGGKPKKIYLRVDQSGGPGYSVVGHNCQGYAIDCLRYIGVNEPELYAFIFLQPPLLIERKLGVRHRYREVNEAELLPSSLSNQNISGAAQRRRKALFMLDNKEDFVVTSSSFYSPYKPFARPGLRFWIGRLSQAFKAGYRLFKGVGGNEYLKVGLGAFLLAIGVATFFMMPSTIPWLIVGAALISMGLIAASEGALGLLRHYDALGTWFRFGMPKFIKKSKLANTEIYRNIMAKLKIESAKSEKQLRLNSTLRTPDELMDARPISNSSRIFFACQSSSKDEEEMLNRIDLSL